MTKAQRYTMRKSLGNISAIQVRDLEGFGNFHNSTDWLVTGHKGIPFFCPDVAFRQIFEPLGFPKPEPRTKKKVSCRSQPKTKTRRKFTQQFRNSPKVSKKLGIQAAALNILRLLGTRSRGMTSRMIFDATALRTSTVSMAFSELEEKGYMTRVKKLKSGSKKLKVQWAVISKKGLKLLKKVFPHDTDRISFRISS